MDLRERIIAAASELFRAEGLDFTLQEVAEGLRISKKTIYTIYDSKEELLLDMVDTLFRQIHQRKEELMASALPMEEKIRAVIIALPEEYATLDFRQMDALEERYPAVARRVREQLETGWEPTIALLERGMAEGILRPVSIPVLRRILTASFEDLLSEGENGDGAYADELETMIDIIMNGIRRRADENEPV